MANSMRAAMGAAQNNPRTSANKARPIPPPAHITALFLFEMTPYVVAAAAKTKQTLISG